MKASLLVACILGVALYVPVRLLLFSPVAHIQVPADADCRPSDC